MVKAEFNSYAKTYKEWSDVQVLTGSHLIQKLKETIGNKAVSSIIDLGCGDGCGTNHLHKTLKSASTLGIDSSTNMIERATRNYSTINTLQKNPKGKSTPQLNFQLNTIQDLDAAYFSEFDLIYSNASLQWVSDLQSFFQKIKQSRAINSDQMVSFSLFTSKTLTELSQGLESIGRTDSLPTATFLDKESIGSILKSTFTDVVIWHESIVKPFTTINELFDSLKYTGVRDKDREKGLWTPRQLRDLKSYYEKNWGQYRLTYDVVYGVISR
ncbi:methyltransferase domain-containing protein [bacterium]|jgi:malonyl-ACP O-methyltransferase BioC|nr:methyltransferase domain-containing protein [bacterium]